MSGANGWGLRGRAQQHLGEGGKKLRKKRKQQLLSWPLAPAGEVAPPMPLPRGRPLPFTPLRTHYYAALDPSNCSRSPTTPPLPLTPGPIPTKFQRKLPAQSAACSGQQVGSGASRAGPLLARPTPLLPGQGPGAPGSGTGRGSSLPYLRHICRTDGSHLRGGRSWVTARTRM